MEQHGYSLGMQVVTGILAWAGKQGETAGILAWQAGSSTLHAGSNRDTHLASRKQQRGYSLVKQAATGILDWQAGSNSRDTCLASREQQGYSLY